MTNSQLSVTATSPGKVNLYFAVGDVQENGYHPVASLYAAVSLREEVTVTASTNPGISLSLEIPADSLLARMQENGDFDPASVPLDESNLAYRAAQAVLNEQKVSADIHLHILKNVPVAGGMAGGSADAAAALKAVNSYLYEAGLVAEALPQEKLMKLGAQLGADVPFCLMGGMAIGYGVGDQLTPIDIPDDSEPLHLVMVLNKRGLSTPSVFKELDEGRASGKYPPAGDLEVPQALIDALQDSKSPQRLERIVQHLRNDLQAPAIALAPELEETLGITETPESDAVAAFVSGSGPTVALVSKDAQKIVQKLSTQKIYSIACHIE